MTEMSLRIRALTLLSVALLLAVAYYPVTQHSAGLDELTLLANLPLDSLSDILAPLPKYSQASPPVFTVLLSLLADLDVAIIRAALAAIIVTGTLLGSGLLRSPPLSVLIAAMAILALTSMVEYSITLKHYGFEILGTVIIIGWLTRKHPHSELGTSDLFILILGAVVGISTLVIAALALGVHMGGYYFHKRSLPLWSAALSLLFLIFILAYYFLIQHISSLQISNYPDTYSSSGLSASGSFLSTIINASRNPALAPLFLLALAFCWQHRQEQKIRRLAILFAAVIISFSILAFMGKYPATLTKHVVWIDAFLLTVILYGGETIPASTNPRRRRIKYIVFFLLLGIASLRTAGILFDEEKSFGQNGNGEAVQWLLDQDPTDIGLWSGAQPVIEYYQRRFPELAKHRYFGIRNSTSAPPAANGHFSEERIIELIEGNHKQPGNWDHAIEYYRLINNHEPMARSLLALAPRDKSFLIFSSNVAFGATRGRARNWVEGLTGTLKQASCNHEPVLNTRSVFILKVTCPDAGTKTGTTKSN